MAQRAYSVVRANFGSLLKRLLLGRAMRSDRLGETLLPKRLALPIFASDALSSVAYAPDEIMLMLGLAGGAFVVTHSWQITIAVILVMVVVVASYRQNVHAYPSGGGDYEVATVNLGPKAGLTVASALLVDYVLTVAVSVSSGVQNAGTVLAVRARQRGPRGGRHHRLPHRDEPARRARVGQGLRRPDLPVHARHHRHGRLRLRPAASPAPWRRPRAPASPSCPSPATRRDRARGRVPAAARLLVGLRRPDRRRGDLQRRAGLPQAQEPQRRHDPAAHGRRCRSRCSPRSSR